MRFSERLSLLFVHIRFYPAFGIKFDFPPLTINAFGVKWYECQNVFSINPKEKAGIDFGYRLSI